MKRILMLGLVLALLATMILSTAAFACGGSGTGGNQEQNGASNGPAFGPCAGQLCTCIDGNGDGECGKP